jgi:hypothetical protein
MCRFTATTLSECIQDSGLPEDIWKTHSINAKAAQRRKTLNRLMPRQGLEPRESESVLFGWVPYDVRTE